MGKGKTIGKPSLGRTLIKEKRQASGRHNQGHDQWLHTSELQDGYDWGRLNLRSVTEQTAINDFLATAELADREFVAEKGNVQIITTHSIHGIYTDEELSEIRKVQSQNEKFVGVPRRPAWDQDTSAEELQKAEKESFLTWRRQLALLQESDGKLLLTPYEKNLDIWRQLWRVIERSDVICQIVDARDPLLYRCDDLDRYVAEVDKQKRVLLIINKSDFLSELQRKYWCDYFTSLGIRVVFWSALAESEEKDATTTEDEEKAESSGCPEEEDEDSGDDGPQYSDAEDGDASTDLVGIVTTNLEDALNLTATEPSSLKADPSTADTDKLTSSAEIDTSASPVTCTLGSHSSCKDEAQVTALAAEVGRQPCCDTVGDQNTTHVLSRSELVELFRTYKEIYADSDKAFVTIGLVGYPNVGKSSTINALLEAKKTSVSATPGKTKHFQTLFLDEDICLCDCPGLVFPQFVTSKAEMVLGGILPIDELRDCIPPVTLLCRRIPRHVLETTYGINIPSPAEGEQQDRLPTAHEVLSSYASMRGFMTSHGSPDTSRASRYVLKDYVRGRLLYCTPPPGIKPDDFKAYPSVPADLRLKLGSENKGILISESTTKKIDAEFFRKRSLVASSYD